MAYRERESISEEPLSQYLDAIAQYDLLTAEEEVELAQKMEIGKAAHELLDSEIPLDPTVIEELSQQVQVGQAARERFINANLRLVVSIARRYHVSDIEGKTLLDHIQEGNTGLIRAVDKFDWRKGFKFSTYATWWIKQPIDRHNNSSYRIKIPVHLGDTMIQVREGENILLAQGNMTPSVAEIAHAAGLDESSVALVLRARYMKNMDNLDQPLSDDGYSTRGELVEDDSIDVQGSALEKIDVDRLRILVTNLPQRHREVLIRYYGLDGNPPETHKSISRSFGIGTERIRQIRLEALSELHRTFQDEAA
jgi:RNA polymerase sigma factor (sigma-70 family)